MKLIDPNELEKVLRLILTDESCPLHIAADIDMNIDLMPKVDAVPVVRCKDCKFFYQMTAETGICELGCPHLGNDGFCSEGEQKDGDHHEE